MRWRSRDCEGGGGRGASGGHCGVSGQLFSRHPGAQGDSIQQSQSPQAHGLLAVGSLPLAPTCISEGCRRRDGLCTDVSIEETNISPADKIKMMRVLRMSPHNGN